VSTSRDNRQTKWKPPSVPRFERGSVRKAFIWILLALLMCATIWLAACRHEDDEEPKQEMRATEVPSNVFTLRDEVLAFEAHGEEGARFDAELDISELRNRVDNMDTVLLLQYTPDSLTELARLPDGARLSASFVVGRTYLVFALPTDFWPNIYYVLCQLNQLRAAPSRVDPGFLDPICLRILCAPDQFLGKDLYTEFPDLEQFRDELDFDSIPLGGWDPTMTGGSICDRCLGYRQPEPVFPTKKCTKPPQGTPAVVKVINMIPETFSSETNQDSEPFLTVDPTATDRMVGSAFTVNPNGFGTGLAPVFITTDGGDTWWLNNIIPSDGVTGDITLGTVDVPRRLYAGILRRSADLLMDILRTNDFTGATPMAVLSTRPDVDQPFLQAKKVSLNDRVYVGNNDFSQPGGRTATVDVSLDGGATFNSFVIESRATLGQDGPSVRPTISGDGTVYVAYFGWRSVAAGNLITSDVVVVRDDNGATGATPFQDLLGSDGLSGVRMAAGVTIPWSNAQTLGFERIGSTLSAAVHPTNSDIVYVAWCDRVGTGDIYTVHVRRSTDRGVNWTGDLRTITNATCCAVAIANNGTVGLLYQQYTGSGSSSRWITNLEQTRDGFTNMETTRLANVPGNQPAPQFLPYIGDYNFLLSVGQQFRGIFSANNTPDPNNFPSGVTYQRYHDFSTKTLKDGGGNPVAISIDPFYFSVPTMR